MSKQGGDQGTGKLGVWLIGASGGLATTMIVGARMIARGMAGSTGLLTETEAFAGIPLRPFDALVFGGHDIRPGSVLDAALEMHRDTGAFSVAGLEALRADLEAVDAEIRSGTILNCGATIEGLASVELRTEQRSLAEIVAALRADLAGFRQRHGLDRLVVINLASTEPPVAPMPEHEGIAGLRTLVAADRRDALRASSLYTLAALEEGAAFINFTPSNAALLPGHVELAMERGLPVMGNDGKTGETLVKSALAPMFKYRNLRVMTWQGYNILGDRDGQVLADERNKASKIATKDSVLGNILGYQPHTKVSIDYVPSLGDMKTAWDFIHFQGFLDFKMSLQFTWQGCDAILAAPIVLDMLRLADLASARGEAGLMRQLASFFKRPLGVDEQGLHAQFHGLTDYIAGLRRP
ncbi:MAG: inositol-3-phosphate synthase [Planctomycetes bacterium]|nr:inositol-3-phosphate synthase [Planctomycetota bacterium]